MESEKIQLSISLLVSNTIDTIKKCMDSLVPILNSIPSELIIVDTGGTDGSIEVARQYTDKIVSFPWCHDFAKARNAGMEQARGEWFMFLDDDEWFEDPAEIIDFFKSGEYREYNCASYNIRNYRDRSGTTWNDTRYTRMVKMEENTRFVSPIHEVIQPTFLPEKIFECYVHHYGYVFDTEEEKRKHAQRNLVLLEKVLEEDKLNHRLTIQLAQEYGFIQENERSIGISKEDLKIIDKKVIKTENDIIYAGWHMNNIINLEILIENRKQSYKDAQEYYTKKWINLVTKNNLTHVLARLAFEFKKEGDCIRYLDTYLETYDILQKDQRQRLRQTITDQCKSYNEENYYLSLLAGFKSANKLNRHKKIKEYLERMSNTKFFLTTIPDFIELINGLWNLSDETLKIRIIEGLFVNDTFRKFLAGIIEDETSAIPRKELMEFLSSYGEQYAEFFHYRLMTEGGREGKIKELFDQYFEKEKNILFLNPELMDLFMDRLNMMEYIQQLSPQDWLKKINVFVENAPWDSLKKLQEVCKSYEGYDPGLCSLKIRCYEKLLSHSKLEEMEFSFMDGVLKDYLDVVLNFNLLIYREEVFTSELEFFLPDNCRFCNKIQRIYEEGLDELAKAKIIREAVDLYPLLASFSKIYIKKMQEEAKKATDEFLQLGEMIKKSIRTYIAIGQKENARMTLAQLEQLIPHDPELLELKKLL